MNVGSDKINNGYDKTYILFEGDGVIEAMIYTLKSSKKDNWYYRFKIAGSGNYKKKSLKTTNKTLAITKAKELYFQMLYLKDSGYDINDKPLKVLWNEYINVRNDNQQSIVRYSQIWNSYLEEYFKDICVYHLNRSLFINYWKWRKEFWVRNGRGTSAWKNKYQYTVKTYAETPSHSTLRREQSVLRSFIRYIKTKHIISVDGHMDINAPYLKLNNRKIIENSRGRFWDREDFTRFFAWLTDRCKSAGYIKSFDRKKPNKTTKQIKEVNVGGYYRHSNKRTWEKTKLFIQIISHTGLRVEELRHMRYCDYIPKDKGKNSMGFFDVKSEVAKPKQGVGKHREALIFFFDKFSDGSIKCLMKPLIDNFRNDYYPNSNDDDYIFCSDIDNRNPADMGHMVRRALIESGYYLDKNKKKRSGTTFRHYFAQSRVDEGILPMSMIADTMGNTVSVLEKTYLSSRAEPKFDILIQNAEKIVQSPDLIAVKEAIDKKAFKRIIKLYKDRGARGDIKSWEEWADSADFGNLI